ncbi:MAG TPA: hypothetical protein VN889_04880 [Solirubrobacteraceae bacterium]|nr:hypothetical protein [Solirubrobacteraceae bacterium]
MRPALGASRLFVGVAIVALASSVPVAAVAAQVAAPAAQAAAPKCQTVSPAIRSRNAAAERLTKQLLRNTSYTPRAKTFTPKITSTRGFTGYGSIVLAAPKGTTPVAGYFVLRGTEPCSVVVTGASIVLRRNAYVVSLKFPGEQGDPGRIAVTLVSR